MSKTSNLKTKITAFYSRVSFETNRIINIGKRMFFASKVSNDLQNCYLQLGRLAVDSNEANELKWDHPKAKELFTNIQKLKVALEEMEKEVSNLKSLKNNDTVEGSH